MSQWKLCRQKFGNEEFELNEGEVTIGRGLSNTIKLRSIVISRNHCSIRVNQEEVSITDLKSANGVYVGLQKITPNTPHQLNQNDVIGLGWTIGGPPVNLKDTEKYVYKLEKKVSPEMNLKRKIEEGSASPEVVIVDSEHGSDVEEVDLSKGGSGCDIPKPKRVKLEDEHVDVADKEKEDLQYEVFKDKQAFSVDDDEIEIINSDSDVESDHLIVKLSQNSPGKPPVKVEKPDGCEANNSFSQKADDAPIDLDEIDDVQEVGKGSCDEDDKFIDLTQNDDDDDDEVNDPKISKSTSGEADSRPADAADNDVSIVTAPIEEQEKRSDGTEDTCDNSQKLEKDVQTSTEKKGVNEEPIESIKPPVSISENPLNKDITERKSEDVKDKSSKHSTAPKETTLTDSQEEKRGQKLEEVCEKKESSTRTDTKRNSDTRKTVSGARTAEPTTSYESSSKSAERGTLRPRRTTKLIEARPESPVTRTRATQGKQAAAKNTAHEPAKKIVKRVRFSLDFTEVHTFDIDPGNNFKSTKWIQKHERHLIDVPLVRLSLKKTALLEILVWNPQWLSEQDGKGSPPPIVCDRDTNLTLFMCFSSYEHYVEQMEKLLLIEIWEYLTLGYRSNEHNDMQVYIEALPPRPAQDRYRDLYTLTIKLPVSPSSRQPLPREGDIMMLKMWNHKLRRRKCKFCYINNVIHMPSKPNRKERSVILSCNVTYSDLFDTLKPGDKAWGRHVANVNNELAYFVAMEHLRKSPLRDVILKPEPHLYEIVDSGENVESKWTEGMNSSQLRAVSESVSAALLQAPALRMVQGPPGTGKSSVICAIVMNYFYGSSDRMQSKRGKILICAKSNAAVDELVVRLLDKREGLRPEDRFRLVRVGRLEAMHTRAKDCSTQALALRNKASKDTSDPALQEEKARCEVQINKWKIAKTDDPARAAYCADRVKYWTRQKELLCGGDMSPRQQAEAERQLVEGADIVATTLSSAVNHKMQRLKGIALCIVDEAGQAIEPESLLPLSLGVSKITLVGDPQQLPGYVSSQRAKHYGLDRSLFSRLSTCSEDWERRPVVLLDRQYRMHPAIADYPSRAFYAGRVTTVAPAPVHIDLPPYCLLGVSESVRQDCSTTGEAWGAARVALALQRVARAHRPPLTAAVITPYVAHRDQLRTCLAQLDESARSLEVNTVDSFQGRERDVVLVWAGRRAGAGFLAHTGRLNVLLTRARHALLLCLHPHAFNENDQWRTLVEDAKEKNIFRTLPSRMCQRPRSSAEISSEDVLEFLRSDNKREA